jgi:catechol 2,3-dioxygenase-like lactoylglutathione lyase family enzyme
MKVSSVSGFVLIVEDLDKTAKFYEDLGFRFGRREDDRLVVYVNWFSVDFVTVNKSDRPVVQKEAALENRGAGVWFLISVSNVDEFYEEAKKAGLKIESEPEDRPTGRREFIMRDPDGYKLVFFAKK